MARDWTDKEREWEWRYYSGRYCRNLWKYIPQKVEDGIDEIGVDYDGYWIYLKEGWTSLDGGEDCGIIHDYTIDGIKDAVSTIRRKEKTA